MMKKILVPLFIFLSQIDLYSEKKGIRAESVFKNQEPKLMKFSWENDLFFQSDREYTNGVKIEYGEYQFLHSPSSWLLGGLSLLSKKISSKKKEYSGINFTQQVFTPSNLQRSDISRGERPYSGYTQLSFISSYLYESSSLSIELGYGLIGPSSKGKFFQSKIHEIVQSSLPEGWDTQIPNQKILQISSEYQYFFVKQFGFMTTLKYGGFDSSAGLGPIFRIGNIKSSVSQGVNLNSITPSFNIIEKENYFYFQPKIIYQTWNGTLQASSRSLPSNVDPYEIPFAISTANYNRLFSDPLYNSVSDQNSLSYYNRFYIFQEIINPKADFGINYLIFNSIFNGGELPSENLKNLIVSNILSTNTNNIQYPGLDYFINQSLFRQDGQSISPYVRFMAYNYLLGSNSDVDRRDSIASILYLNEIEGNKRYSVPLRNFQGKINMGYVVQSEAWYIQIWGEISNLEYLTNSFIPQFHRFAGLQYGYKFD